VLYVGLDLESFFIQNMPKPNITQLLVEIITEKGISVICDGPAQIYSDSKPGISYHYPAREIAWYV